MDLARKLILRELLFLRCENRDVFVVSLRVFWTHALASGEPLTDGTFVLDAKKCQHVGVLMAAFLFCFLKQLRVKQQRALLRFLTPCLHRCARIAVRSCSAGWGVVIFHCHRLRVRFFRRQSSFATYFLKERDHRIEPCQSTKWPKPDALIKILNEGEFIERATRSLPKFRRDSEYNQRLFDTIHHIPDGRDRLAKLDAKLGPWFVFVALRLIRFPLHKQTVVVMFKANAIIWAIFPVVRIFHPL